MSYSLELQNLVERLSPCDDAVAYLAGQASLEAAWNNCSNPDWMLWLLTHDKLSHNASQLRLLACAFVRETPLADGRKVWDLLTDERSRNAVEVAERHARGEASAEELEVARDAARAAAWDAASAFARAAAWSAAWAAAWSAASAFARAAGAARAAASAVQCDIIRKFYSWQDVAALLEGE